MVESHAAVAHALACGIHAVPEAKSSFSATQAAYRFLSNPQVSLRSLAEPLLAVAARDVAAACERYALVVHDWSQVMYPEHRSKQDRVSLSSRGSPEGYELQTGLVIGDRDGEPIAPVTMGLRAADGVHCSRSWQIREPLSPLDELDPAMTFVERLPLGRPVVHVIDAEADSVAHFREWSSRPGRLFLVRADDRIVEVEGQEQRCSAIAEDLRRKEAFKTVREVKYHGRAARQSVAEVTVRLVRPAQRNRPKQKDRRRIVGPPLELRLVISEVYSPQGPLLARWFLLSNVPGTVDVATLALWYYWRWRIESFFKLMKSAGMQVESWQQESASAIAKRLLIASMACVVVWQLARSTHPEAAKARSLLVRLSGRQMKYGRAFTTPALLAGLWALLSMLHVLEDYDPNELRTLAAFVLGTLTNRPP